MVSEPRGLSADQQDALQEVVNVAMGQAGDSLARILDAQLSLSVPRARIVGAGEAARYVVAMTEVSGEAMAVRQSFHDRLRGEAMVVFGPRGCRNLADLLGHEGELDRAQEQELVLDVANILVGAVLKGVGDQVGWTFRFRPPELLAGSLDQVMNPTHLRWRYALLVEVNFTLPDRDFRCHLILLMPEHSIDEVRGALDRLLADL